MYQATLKQPNMDQTASVKSKNNASDIDYISKNLIKQRKLVQDIYRARHSWHKYLRERSATKKVSAEIAQLENLAN